MATTLKWDDVKYHAGIDRAVFYQTGGDGIAWSGLVSVTEELTGADSTPIYFDGIKYADNAIVGEFSGSIKAYTYPDEFLEYEGISYAGNGLYVTSQQPKRFGLSYRTMVNDQGYYKIHVLYNVTATPNTKTYTTLSSSIEPMMFEWSINAIPTELPGYRASAHFIFDTSNMSASLLQDLEDQLYGDGISMPHLPEASTLLSFIGGWVVIRITDLGNGTWTATGPDNLVYLTNATTFEIANAAATFTDANTYVISDLTY